jgi:hypothetical protein
MATAQIYSTKGGMAYQIGNSRTLIDAKGCAMFQKRDGGEWRNGRNSYALNTIEKVKAALSK